MSLPVSDWLSGSSLPRPAPMQPAALVSPYPASSYHTWLHTHIPAAIPAAEHKEQLLTDESADKSALFQWRSTVPRPRISRTTKTVSARPREDWKLPVKPEFHLPVLKELMTQPATNTTTDDSTVVTLPPITPPSTVHNGIYEYTAAYEQSLCLETGEDAIAYFSRHGAQSTVKFVYANRANYTPTSASANMNEDSGSESEREGETELDYRPYDLTIVDLKHINPHEYFTISSTGIIYIQSAAPTEVISLQSWIHQSHLFQLLRSIRFFKHYLIAKCFRLWKLNVRYRLYCQQRKSLSQKLFLARQSFCQPLLEINEICADMLTQTISNVRQGGIVYSVETFLKDQQEARQSGQKGLESMIEKMETKVETVCRGVKDRARLFDHRIANEELSHSRFAQHLLGSGASSLSNTSGGPNKIVSMVQAKQEKKNRFRQLAAANEEADRLGSFIQLVDLMHCQTFYEKSLEDTRGFLAFLLNSAKPLFGTTVTFAPRSATTQYVESDGLLYQPTVTEICSMLTQVQDSNLGCFDSLARLAWHPKFAPFLTGATNNANKTNSSSNGGSGSNDSTFLSISSMVHSDAGYSLMMDSMQSRLTESFIGIHDSLKFLAKHRVIQDYGERLGHFDTQAISQSLSLNSDVMILTKDMEQLVQWQSSLQHIRDFYSYKISQADLRALKLALLPVCESGQAKIKEKLMNLFLSSCESIITEYQALILQCKDDPVILSQFVDFILSIERIKLEEKQLNGRLMELEQLHDLLKQLNIYQTILPSDQVKYDEAFEYHNHFHSTVLDSVRSKLETKSEEMKQKVMQEIKKHESALEQLNKAIDDSPLYYDYATASLRDTLSSLDADSKKLKDLTKKVDELNRQQSVLEDSSHNYRLIPIITEKVEKKKLLFAGIEAFKDKEKKWNFTEIEKFDDGFVSETNRELTSIVNHYSINTSAKNNASERLTEREKKEFELVKSIKNELAHYEVLIPIFADLRFVYSAVGADDYRASFSGLFGHLKRVKDLKKLDWVNNPALRQAVAAKVAEIKERQSPQAHEATEASER